jgi:hypothetical protein
VNGRTSAPTGAHSWRTDVSPAQLLRAAAGLEEIAEASVGLRRKELREMAADLRERAAAWRIVDVQRRRQLHALAH